MKTLTPKKDRVVQRFSEMQMSLPSGINRYSVHRLVMSCLSRKGWNGRSSGKTVGTSGQAVSKMSELESKIRISWGS